MDWVRRLNITNVYTSDNFLYIYNIVSIEISSVFVKT